MGLSNREWALGIWLIFAIFYVFVKKSTRDPFLQVVKIAFCKKFVVVYVLILLYLSLLIYLLYKLGFWNMSLLKDTIIWFLFTGIISAFGAIEKAKDFNYFKSLIKEQMKLTLLLEFILNLYTFNLVTELILLPVVTLIMISISILNFSPEFQNEKSKPVKKLFTILNSGIGFAILINALYLAAKDISNLGTFDNLRSLLLPPILSILFLGFVYFFALWSSYEQIFIRIRFGEHKSNNLVRYIKFKILILCGLNINKTNRFWKVSGLKTLNIKSKSDVLKIIADSKRELQRNSV